MAAKLSKQVENTVGKGEIARYKQFLLFPQCFHKACFPGASKGVIVWEWVKQSGFSLNFLLRGQDDPLPYELKKVNNKFWGSLRKFGQNPQNSEKKGGHRKP